MARSVNVDFFAAERDQRALFDFLFQTTDVHVFESYSELGTDLREFRSTAEVASAFPLGVDKVGNGNAVLLQLWSPSVMSRLSIERITLNPSACNGHTFRYRIDGGGLMQLYLGGVSGNVVTKSHFGHQSQARAQAWDVATGVDWSALKRLSSKIQYHLRHRAAVAKAGSCPVLAEAFELAQSGHDLKIATQSPWKYELKATDA